jgi:enoyl-CoA hydratase
MKSGWIIFSNAANQRLKNIIIRDQQAMTITLAFDDDVAHITIDDGGKNVINHEVLDELETAWEKVEADAKALILSGRPGSFCAGYDISVMTGDEPDAATRLGQRGGRFAHKLFGSRMPTVAVSTGHAFTIGAIWLACCDIRIGESGRFKYGMSEVALNVPFPAWPLEPLKERLNPRQLIPAILHARIYEPEGAVEAGFIDELVGEGEGMEKARALASELAKLPGKAYGQSKRQLRSEALAVMAEDLGL